MSVFNSLGSNYDSPFVWRSLLARGSKKDITELQSRLTEHYLGRAVLTYKGRQALELAFKHSGLPAGSRVGINGFTCYVVYQAVVRAGYKPVFLDVAAGQLDFGIAELKKAHQANPLKAVVIQNTLGYPVDMPTLKAFCNSQNVLIVEDLAHSFGARYSDGTEAGKVGDLTMLSFSQDKPLDVVAGGALIDRRAEKEVIDQPTARVSSRQRALNTLYPCWTMLIRRTYGLGLGRYIHFGLKKLHLLATPMSDNVQGIFTMEPAAANLALERWDRRLSELEHRRTIAQLYTTGLPETLQIKPTDQTTPTYLRFPILVKDRPALIAYLKSKAIYIGDTWYDAPVAPKRYLPKTTYINGECPQSEALCAQLVNLPTHLNVSQQQAKDIIKQVGQWLKSQ